MDLQQMLQQIGERVSVNASVKNVYGDPIPCGDRVVIPAARVRYAFGGGGGRSAKREQLEGGGAGAGGRVSLHPCGAIEVGPAGARCISFDSGRVIAAAFGIALTLGIAIGGCCRGR